MKKLTRVEYVWLDGTKPVAQLRSKVRYLKSFTLTSPENIPVWNFDGSSTEQATGQDSDRLLKPVAMYLDPVMGNTSTSAVVVLCEVFGFDGQPVPSNTRAQLRDLANLHKNENIWMGFEQEYVLINNKTQKPMGFPKHGYPRAQGPYYCAIGTSNVSGREIVEEHAAACLEMGLMIYGTNAEVLLGQWEFQIGYRGLETEVADPLTVSDHLWMARFLLHRIAEKHGVSVSLDCKPVAGDWNGSGCHTNFSTKATRSKATGLSKIENAIKLLEKKHLEHIAVYGSGLEKRLTGAHETCSIHEFKWGAGHRGASVRIPQPVQAQGYGYFEDRRPGANCDPYQVSAQLIQTIFGE